MPIVCQLLTEALEGADPSVTSCLTLHLRDRDRDAHLETLIELKQVSDPGMSSNRSVTQR